MRGRFVSDRPIACLLFLCVSCVVATLGRTEEPSPSARQRAGAETAASRSVMVGVSGPRKGLMPARYFNVQGPDSRDDAKLSSFGVLEFPLPAAGGESAVEATDAPQLTLVLTQSIPPFARPGRVTIWVAEDPSTDLDELRFILGEQDALGDRAGKVTRCGALDFVVDRTDREDRIPLDIPRESLKAITAGGVVRLFVLPEETGVAATWFGTDQPPGERHPRLLVE